MYGTDRQLACLDWCKKPFPGQGLYEYYRQCAQEIEYPALKRAVREQRSLFGATVVLIEDKASGTQLIQELITEGCHGATRYQPTGDKTMRLNAQTAVIESGFVHIPETAPWLAGYSA